MSLGLEVAILPGLAVARRMDKEGDWKRQLIAKSSNWIADLFRTGRFFIHTRMES